ncbi:MAG: protein phosphatase 2C domain-containing protein [Dysgonamonadaceae bacterium]|jgi:serine/threonine protein phosphatase PrpC|nr:protein phosphatase 2C domain-containing protein [Dysgonamonadaceae bacterium]
MAIVKLRLAARCEAAGRSSNEDNYQIIENLSEGKWGFTTDEEIDLSGLGTLLVVADGMGGLDAGEVASELAIETVKEWFSAENLSKESFEYPFQIKSYIKKTIQAADRRIKRAGEKDNSISGMGSTIVLAWIINRYVYVGWCGDSRAYRYNPTDGFTQLSHDHSYVQELVDKGKLQPELAFDFPDRNIITRSLGDTRRKANPDILDFPLHNGDLFLLCSDGLSGVLRDEQLAEIIAANTDSLRNCGNALWKASFEAEWDDNVTFILCQILSGVEVEKQEKTVKIGQQEEKPSDIVQSATPKRNLQKWKRWKIWWAVATIIFAIAVATYCLKNHSSRFTKMEQIIKSFTETKNKKNTPEEDENSVVITDSVATPKTETPNEPERVVIESENKKQTKDKETEKAEIDPGKYEFLYEDSIFKASQNTDSVKFEIIKSTSKVSDTAKNMTKILIDSCQISISSYTNFLEYNKLYNRNHGADIGATIKEFKEGMILTYPKNL